MCNAEDFSICVLISVVYIAFQFFGLKTKKKTHLFETGQFVLLLLLFFGFQKYLNM